MNGEVQDKSIVRGMQVFVGMRFGFDFEFDFDFRL